MKIEVYLDDDKTPYKVLQPPEKFKLNSKELSDGTHHLRFRAGIEKNGIVSAKEIEFVVNNGPSIALHGIRDGEVVSGEVSVLANAYSSRIGDEFEPLRIETPTPIPTWAWVLCLVIFSWAVGYLTWEYGTYSSESMVTNSPSNEQKELISDKSDTNSSALGEQIYGNYCASCHQSNGQGLPGVFPSLVDNETVLNDDASQHIDVVLNGLKDKVIAGVNYPAPMPGFGAQLSDEEVAEVVNHERSQWGNNATKISSDAVTARR